MKDTLTCSNCSHENPAKAKFCQNCGEGLARLCPECGTHNGPTAKFCMDCGTSLELTTPATSETRLSELQRSAPEGLQEKIRASSSEIEGQRKPVTILFADIVGSTMIAEKHDPEVWKEIVSGVHRRVGEAIYRYEGTIAQLLGDGVLAFFGAPITHEDDPLRAVRAALDIQEAMKDYAHELQDLIEDLQMRIGINTGEVVIGNIGTDLHMEYLALGDAVNIAARLQSTADPGKVLLSDPTARLLGDSFELRSLGLVPVKGKAVSVATYEIVGVKAFPERRVGLQEFRTPFVDREQELEALRSSLVKLCEGQGQIVCLVGEPGIGKTRLLEEVRSFLCEEQEDLKDETVSPSSLRWLEGRALSYGGSLSYWAITQLLLTDLGLSDGASQVEIKVALRQRMKELFSEKRSSEVMPYIAKFLGNPLEEKAKKDIEALDGESLKSETHQALGDYFTAVAKKDPSVLVLEDMHWIDPSSLEVLEGLLPLPDHVPLMILMLMRVERDHGSWKLRVKAETDFHHRFSDIHLRRLSELDSQTLVKHLLGSEELPDEILSPILTRAEGNPFYLEEVVRHMIEEGMIVQDDEEWHATAAMEEIGIPDTLQGVLLARIDRLEEDVRYTLQMASVIGKSFLYRILEAISEAERELDVHLSQLQRLDLVREKTRIPELEYIFKQTLTQEAAYNSLLHNRRKVFHLRVGEALEKLFLDRIDDFVGILAYHFEKAEMFDIGVEYLLRAGDQARLGYSLKEAIEYYKRAITILKDQESFDHAARTLMKLGLTYHTAFDFQQSRLAYDEAYALRQKGSLIGPEKRKPPALQPLRITWSNPPTLDPILRYDSASAFCIQPLFSGLVEYGFEEEIIPDIAYRWDVTDDGLKYIFHLRSDVFWSDGIQVTAMDFVSAMLRTLDPAQNVPRGKDGRYFDIKFAREFHLGEVSEPDKVGIRAADPTTLEVELIKPASDFLGVMADLYPQPTHVVEEKRESWTETEHIVTNGPYLLHSYQSEESIIFAKNPNYHGNYDGNLEKIEINLSVPHASSEMLKMYESDIIDIAELRGGTFHARDTYIDEYISEPELGEYLLCFDTRYPPYDDLRVRQALVMAVDREKLASEELDGSRYPATGSLMPPGTAGHLADIGLQFDPDMANELLEQAGYPAGIDFPTIDLFWWQDSKTLDDLKEQWSENLNLKTKITIKDWGKIVESARSMNIFYMGFGLGHSRDPDLSVIVKMMLPNWRDISYDQLLCEAQESTNQMERISLFQKVDRYLIENVIFMPLTYGRYHFLVKPWVKIPRKGITSGYLKDFIIDPH